MDSAQLSITLAKITRQKNLAYMLVFLLAVSLILSCGAAFFKKERIVVVPTVGESYILGENDEVLLEKMGVFLSNLFLNRNPVDSQWKNRQILKHVDPSFYHEFKAKLDEEAGFLVKNKEQAFVFFSEYSYADPKTLTFVTEGKRMVFVGTDGEKLHISQSDRQRYQLGFKRRGDQFLLISLKKEEL